MTEPAFYAIKNWSQFQHYKDRNPAWIKMHFALLASEDWVMLDDASRLLAVVCMLVASRHDGRVPNKPAYLKRIAYLDQEPDLRPLILCGFLTETLAPASTAQADATKRLSRGEERRDREEAEKSSEPNGSGAVAPIVPIDAKTALFREGLETLSAMSGREQPHLRSLVGKWLKLTGNDHSALLGSIRRARDQGVVDPLGWIEASLKPKDPDAEIYRGVI